MQTTVQRHGYFNFHVNPFKHHFLLWFPMICWKFTERVFSSDEENLFMIGTGSVQMGVRGCYKISKCERSTNGFEQTQAHPEADEEYMF